jgi:hypothetical protein
VGLPKARPQSRGLRTSLTKQTLKRGMVFEVIDWSEAGR